MKLTAIRLQDAQSDGSRGISVVDLLREQEKRSFRNAYIAEWVKKDRKTNPAKYRKYKLKYKVNNPEKIEAENKAHYQRLKIRQEENLSFGFCMNHFGRSFAPTSTRLCDYCLIRRRETMKARYHRGVSSEVLEIFKDAQIKNENAKTLFDRLGASEATGFNMRGGHECRSYFGGRLYAREGQVVEIGKLLVKGRGNTSIAEELNIDVKTVIRTRVTLIECAGLSFKCPCGKDGGHIGKCSRIMGTV